MMPVLFMPQALRIRIRYLGRDVNDGTMPIDEVVDALHGFARAYSKVAARSDPEIQHQLRVSAVETGSFDLLILAWLFAQETATVIETGRILTDAARWVVTRITSIIDAKKHTKNKPFDVSVRGNNNTLVIINAEGAELAIPPDAIELFREKIIDSELNKIVAPLREGSVDSAEIVAESEGEPEIKATIASSEREYFRADESVEITREMEIVGTLISLNKETNRGLLKLGDTRSVRYHYAGDDKDSFHRIFGDKGPVRLNGLVTFDNTLAPLHIEINSIHPLQGLLFSGPEKK